MQYYDAGGNEITQIVCPAPGADPLIITPRITTGGTCVSTFNPIAVPASQCPRQSAANIKCTPVTCSTSGETVTLTGTCTSSLSGATLTYYVDGVASTTLTCPRPGVTVLVEPKIENYDDHAACTYRESSPI